MGLGNHDFQVDSVMGQDVSPAGDEVVPSYSGRARYGR